MQEQGGDDREHAQRRLKGFGLHLVGYFVVMAGLVAVKVVISPWTP